MTSGPLYEAEVVLERTDIVTAVQDTQSEIGRADHLQILSYIVCAVAPDCLNYSLLSLRKAPEPTRKPQRLTPTNNSLHLDPR